MSTAPSADWWEHIDKQPDGCWIWTGPATVTGRGRITVGGETVYAYRFIWELVNNTTIPDGMVACHRCDVPACVNPEHIFIGTHLDNMRDAKEKGRIVPPPVYFGVDHHNTRHSPDQIRAASAMYRTGRYSQKAIGRLFGAAQSTVGRWVRGEVRPDAAVEALRVGKNGRSSFDGWSEEVSA